MPVIFCSAWRCWHPDDYISVGDRYTNEDEMVSENVDPERAIQRQQTDIEQIFTTEFSQWKWMALSCLSLWGTIPLTTPCPATFIQV
ncbi:MAG: hypothetical protein U5K69_04520 [Balneolaceae bacterium]|nr:hypothetical protein [Balneolaceae bacterium]